MAIDIWWYAARQQWCVEAPTKNGRKRLYLGPDEVKARAELHRYMAAYYDDLSTAPSDSRPVLRKPAGGPSLGELAVRFLKWTQANRAMATAVSYRDGLPSVAESAGDSVSCRLGISGHARPDV